MAGRAITWITGASSGLGAALAETVPFDGPVVDFSRSGAAAATEHVAVDLAEPASWETVEERLLADLDGFAGERAVFIHNAGVIDPIGFAGEVDSKPYRRNAVLNAAAPQALGHAFLRALRETGFPGTAELVMITSGAASNPYAGWSGYSAGKAAVDTWVRTVGLEHAHRGSRCRVLAVAPGVIATPMQERIRTVGERDFPRVGKFVDLYERGQLIDPADAARRLWGVLDDPSLETGSVVDLRSRS